MHVVSFLEKVNDELTFLSKNKFEINDVQLSTLIDNNKFIIDSYGKPLKYEIKNLCLKNTHILTTDNIIVRYQKSNLYLAAFYTAYYLETYNKSYLKDDEDRKPFETLSKIRYELLYKTSIYKDDNFEVDIINILIAFGEALLNISLLQESIDVRQVTMLYNFIVKSLNEIKKKYDERVERLHSVNKGPHSPTLSDSIEKHYDIINFIDEIIEDVERDLGQLVEFEYMH